MSRAVLVVDDDQFIRKLVATTLEDVSEFDLHEASDGVEALEVAQGTQPAIVFLDIDMPRMDGIDTCRRMRADPPLAKSRTCESVAIVVSPGNVVIKAPCAHPRLTACCGVSPFSSP